MEELSRTEFARLNATEREAYLSALLGDCDDNVSNRESDSDDNDWPPDDILPERETLDSDEYNIHNQEIPAALEIDTSTEEDDEEDEDVEEEREEEGESDREDQAAAMETPCAYIAKDKTV
ncbi:uncharacterized protein [Diabrotica undecimpunctata]|uniref:uncharacterized protein n=1 Tax=Diabrotica undecimpunctata TaxID=50387 RepID=UPI003B63357A